MEKDDEVKGVGNSYTTLFRAYDPRLGRWLSLDPKSVETPWQSPYAGMDNNPIRFNDPLGDKVRNKHESDRNTSKNKMDVAEKNLNSYSGNKSSKEFKKLEKEYKKLERNYNKIDEQYQATEQAIKYIKENFPEEFLKLDNIKVGDEIIDVMVEAHDFQFYSGQSKDPINGTMQDLSEGKRRTAAGFMVFNNEKNSFGNKYFRVGITYRIVSSDGVIQNLYHEFRHVHYKLNPQDRNPQITEETQVLDDTEKAFAK